LLSRFFDENKNDGQKVARLTQGGLVKRFAIVVAMLLPLIAAAGAITQTFTFSPNEVSFSRVNNYDVPSLRDYISVSSPGSPIMPVAILQFVVPPTATVTKVEVVNSEKTELTGTYNIYPAQTPRTLSEKRSIPFVEPDAAIYQSGAEFPGKICEFTYTGDKTGYRIGGVEVFPLQYVPTTGKVSLYTLLTLRVTYEENTWAATPLTRKQTGLAAQELRTLVCNPEALDKFAPPARESDANDAEYVIVTADAYVSTLQPLCDWHSKKGYNSVIKTVAWIESNYTGYDNAEKIRNFIKDYYANHGTIFVLLAGSTSTIPSREARSVCSGETGDIPADLYYGSLDWSWDGDHDHIYGEMNDDTVDFYYDVYVGRWPVASTANAQTLLNKAFGYERAPNTSYIKKCYLPYVHLFSSPDYSGKVVSDTISGITPTGWTDQEVNSPSTATFKSAIDAGWGYCHAAAHGDDYGFYTDAGTPIYTTSEAAAQTNGMDKLCVMNSMACIAGNFENMSSLSVTLANNTSGGTVVNMLNSREGWGEPPTMGPSEKMNARFYDFLINYDTFLVGPAMCRGKDYYATLPQGQEVWRWCFYDINLLGDPAMPLWTDTPGTMIVADPDSIFTGPQSVRVTVTSSGNPVTNASVGFYKAGEVCMRALTNSSGYCDVLVSPATTGTIYITVSAQNMLPVQDSARVVAGAPRPYMVYQSVTVDDASGNNNGRLDPGETANLIITVKNAGNAIAHSTQGLLRTASSYITLIDSTSTYGDINANDTSRGDVYQVTASSGTPNGTPVDFTVHVTSSEGSWDAGFSIVVGPTTQPGSVWADIDTANCLLTTCALGSIGWDTPDGQGHGFKWPKAGVSKLYYSGFLFGNSASYIVDHYYGCPASAVNTDWAIVDSVRKAAAPDMGDEEYTSVMSDAGHATPKSVHVTQRAVQVVQPGYDAFTIMVYDINNQGSSAITGCYAGIMADFDIYTSTTPSDRGRADSPRRAVWMRGSNNANPTLGLKVLSPSVASNLTLIDHDRYVYPDTAMSESMKYRFLDGAINNPVSNRNYDWSIVAATGPFDLPAGDNQRVAFAILGGTDSLTFGANADSAQSWWDHFAGIMEPAGEHGGLPRLSFITLAPNPFVGATQISYIMPVAGRLTIRAYDATGSLVSDVFDREIAAGKGAFNWQPKGLAGGVYFLKVSTPCGGQTTKLMLQR
jgi:hypothetical protein